MVQRNISTKSDGRMNVVVGQAFDSVGAENRKKYLLWLNIQNVVACWLVHGVTIRRVTIADANTIANEVDGLITTEKDLALAVTVADCLPVFFWSEEHEIVAIAHAGWRGVVSGIVGSMLKKIAAIGCPPEEIQVAIGPGIHSCHFEIQSDSLPHFTPYPRNVEKRDDKTFVDLYGIAQEQLRVGGILKERVEVSSECTACLSEKYFSYRRDRPPVIETMLASIVRV